MRSFKRIHGPLLLLLLLMVLLQNLVEPSQPRIEGPQGRIMAGSRASFKCSANGSSEDIQVNWLKDGEKIQSNQTKLSSTEVGGERVYHVTSSVTILLEQGDIKSQLTCQILQNSSPKAQKNFPLGDVLRVPPKVRLEIIPPSPVQLDASVVVICKAESFYPDNATIELFAKDDRSRKGYFVSSILESDGSFFLDSFLEMKATKDRNSSMYLCQVEHDSQPLVTESTRLFITRQLKQSENCDKQSIIGPCIAFFLSKVAILLFIFCLFLIKHNRTRYHSGTSQEVRQSGTSS